MQKVSDGEAFCSKVAVCLYQISQLDLQHPTSISEGISWARFLKSEVGEGDSLQDNIESTIGFLAKTNTGRKRILSQVFGNGFV